MLTLNSKLWKGKKLRRNIKIHGELVFFIFHFGRNPTVFIFIVSGLMEIARNLLNPSVCCRGCPQGLPPRRQTTTQISFGSIRSSKILEACKNFKNPQQIKTHAQKQFIGYWIVHIGRPYPAPTFRFPPLHQRNDHCL